MFKKILIANRGAIACRIIRTLKKMKIISVVIYAEDDADSLHVSLADEAFCLGEGRVADTYLNVDKIISIAHQAKVEAIHPGYGFLSENVEFVEQCAKHDLCFIGPRSENILRFGLKHEARALALANAVPLLPGSELLDDKVQALASAQSIGYPVMLKSTAGGGGIGMQLCHDDAQLQQAFQSVGRLSKNNFSHAGMFVEKFIARARHIEIQVFGDGEGQVLALGERDCSSQRRNQKVVEETPAVNLTAETRQAMQDTAIRLMQAVSYRNAGTVEFIYDEEQKRFYFLEVNTRLQVEHGVTEEVYNVDLVEWMICLAAGELPALTLLAEKLKPSGHSIQARIYAEDPNKAFQPSAGLLTQVVLPVFENLRLDTWIKAGIEISTQYDPMLAKIIITAKDRSQAIAGLNNALQQLTILGIETNGAYVVGLLKSKEFQQGKMTTKFLDNFTYQANTIDVLHGGTQSTLQDYPGRTGYWSVGVPPSGPFDQYSFRLGNRLLKNPADAVGLEMTIQGASLQFNQDTQIVLTGARMEAFLDEVAIDFWQIVFVKAGQTLRMGKITGAGARSYLLVKHGFQSATYLNSGSTFTLGRFGGHGGRSLRAGDVLHLLPLENKMPALKIKQELQPKIGQDWQVHVIYGPHGAPDFFTDDDIQQFFTEQWQVHYHSSRTGVRLIGPRPQWARSSGGEAGMHPSNIHDNAYAVGSVDFTGDMPVILGPDGPSLGGFVCPATVIQADLWKIGQLKAGDTLQFIAVQQDQAVALKQQQDQIIEDLQGSLSPAVAQDFGSAIIHVTDARQDRPQVMYRPAGDTHLLVEYGPQVIDIGLRFRVHNLMNALQNLNHPQILDLTPGIRSLQIHYNSQQLNLADLMEILRQAEGELEHEDQVVPARIVHLPLSWDDEACQQAVEKYMRSVRQDAPWCPSNIEFIRRINGLDSIKEVKDIVFNASYLVMGLGDVYLGAPVATPMDPRHRLVTTKYNPARTWTAENSVGIGGSYLCIYGMEGPGGYQFIGRTLQMWNRYQKTEAFQQPWLLRFFDQIRFFPVSHDELVEIRKDFPNGRYHLNIEETQFDLEQYERFISDNKDSIEDFTQRRQAAFDEELQQWIQSGQINFESETVVLSEQTEEETLPENCIVVDSPVAGSVWQVHVQLNEKVEAGDCLLILESMKMEIELKAPEAGRVYAINRLEGQQVQAGQAILILQKVS